MFVPLKNYSILQINLSFPLWYRKKQIIFQLVFKTPKQHYRKYDMTETKTTEFSQETEEICTFGP